MALETGTFIDDLVITNPTGPDFQSFGDDHMRLLKTVLKNTLPNATRAFYFGTAEARTSSGAIAAADQNKTLLADAVSGAIVLTLPAISAVPDGYEVTVMKDDVTGNTVSISAADSIEGLASYLLIAYKQGVRVVSDGSTYRVFPYSPRGAYAPSQSTPLAMKARVAAGSFFNLASGLVVANAIQDTGVITAPSGNPRNDILYLNTFTGVLGVATGAEAASPVDPALPADSRLIGRIRLATSTTQITDALIDDLRVGVLGTGTAAGRDIGGAPDEIGQNAEAYITVASATSTDLGAQDGLNIRITGTTTIEDFGTADAGVRRKVRFISSLTLAYGSTKMKLPGLADIQTIADDTAEFMSLGSGNWICTSYKRADGLSVVTPVNIALETMVDATNGGADDLTVIDFTGLPSTAKRLTLLLDEVSHASSVHYLVQLGDAGGFENTNYVSNSTETTNAGITAGTNNATGFIMHSGTAGQLASGAMVLNLMDAATNLWISSHQLGGNTSLSVQGGGKKALSATLDRLRLTLTSSTFDNGNVSLMVES